MTAENAVGGYVIVHVLIVAEPAVIGAELEMAVGGHRKARGPAARSGLPMRNSVERFNRSSALLLRPCHGSFTTMSTLTLQPTDPKELRPLLHADLDRLPDDQLQLVRRVLLELKLEEVTARLNAGFDEDRAAGKMAQIPEIIREVRSRRSS